MLQSGGITMRVVAVTSEIDSSRHPRLTSRLLSAHFPWDDRAPMGVKNGGETVRATLILMSDWKSKLSAYL
jgi:hypothetical protein